MALDPISAAIDLGSKLIDKFISSPAERDAAKLQLLQMQQTGELAQLTADTDLAKGQLAVNQTEAENEHIFVSGWRPFIGWCCGIGLTMQFILGPTVTWAAELTGHQIPFPALDMGTLMTLLFGMLGLGGMRTAEKIQKIKSA